MQNLLLVLPGRHFGLQLVCRLELHLVFVQGLKCTKYGG
jgi:hypothetical protein